MLIKLHLHQLGGGLTDIQTAFGGANGAENIGWVQGYATLGATLDAKRNKTVADKLVETISVKDFGAKGDGSTDDRDAIQVALNYAYDRYVDTNRMIEIYFPPGRYIRPNDKGSLQIKGNVRLRGAGRLASVIVNIDSILTTANTLITTVGTVSDIELIDMGFEADWGTNNNWESRSQLLTLTLTNTIKVINCRFANSRFMALAITGAQQASVYDCEFYRIVADGCRMTNCRVNIVQGNTFDSVNDDAIAVHTLDSATNPIDTTTSIVGNHIKDSQGITVLGAKRCIINSNILIRPQTRGITVGSITVDTTEGNTSSVAITISNNIIDTMMKGSHFYSGSGAWGGYIDVSSIPPTSTGSGYVGQSNGTGIISPYSYLYTNNTDQNGPVAGNWFVAITGNQLIRTLQPVTKYSDYGFGLRYARNGPVDTEITASTLGLTDSQLVIRNHISNAKIDHNLIWGGGNAINFVGVSGSTYISWSSVVVSNNSIGNWSQYGISMINGVGNIDVVSNEFDGDPLHTSTQRLPNGKWLNAQLHAAIQFGNNIRGLLSNNTFKNMQSVIQGASYSDMLWTNNTLKCNPNIDSGYSANNIGIGVIPNPQRLGGQLIIEDGDPASATYGRTLNICLNSSASIPTSGKYLFGHYCRTATPTIGGTAGNQYVTTGWLRMTNGSTHVLGTDWVEVRSSTGT